MPIGIPTTIGSAGDTVNDTTISFTVTAAVAVGQKVIVCGASSSGAGTTATFADTQGNTYTTHANANSDTACAHIGSAQITTALTTSDTITMTVSGSRAGKLIAGVQVSGLLTPTIDKTAIGSGNLVAWSTAATATTAQADELLIGACAFDTATTQTSLPGAGYTELYDFQNGGAFQLAVQYRIVSATGAYVADGTISSGTGLVWGAAIATFKGVSSAQAMPLPVHLPFFL